MAPLHLRKLIDAPFGPYPEELILNADFATGLVLKLTSVSMECDGCSIGLDESEFLISAPSQSRVADKPLYFYGQLTIESLNWLSSKGQKWLQIDLRKRDEAINPNGRPSGLTLERLYGSVRYQGSRLVVWIRCKRSMQAQFLVNNNPDSLIFFSTFPGYLRRRYEIVSLDVGTFRDSQNFLARYRLLSLIEEIIATDPDKTPIHHRTIDWLVDSYLSRIRTRDLYVRHIFDLSRDSDVDEEGKTTKPRHLRHIPRAEIVGHFAAHADWILAQQLASRSPTLIKLDIPKWEQFCRQVRTSRLEARAEKIKWGLPDGVKSTVKEDRKSPDLSKFGESREFWDRKRRNAQKTKKPKRAAPTRQPSLEIDAPPTRPTPHITSFIYDSDFSQNSTPPASDSETNSDAELPSLVAKIPQYCLRAPVMPAGRFSWQCPGCHYKIDFLNISEENVKGLPAEAVEILKTKRWENLNDLRIQTCLSMMVSQHYKGHLRQNGIEIKEEGGKFRLEPWPSQRIKIPKQNKKKPLPLAMKLEDINLDLRLRSRRT